MGNKKDSKILSTIRKNLYDNIDPLMDYKYSIPAAALAVTGINTHGMFPEDTDMSNITGDPLYNNEIWATYLNIPEEDRHHPTTKIRKSKYTPINSTQELYALNLPSKAIDNLVKEGITLNKGRFYPSNVLGGYGMNNHSIATAIDPNKGLYVAYKDIYDLNPFHGDRTIANIPILSDINDASMGIGTPVNIYDRVYLDDYFGINSAPNKGDFYGGYLPEVEVTKANGGFISSLQDNEASQIKYLAHTNNIPSVRYDEGGPLTLEEYNIWKELNSRKHNLTQAETTQWSALTRRAHEYERLQKQKEVQLSTIKDNAISNEMKLVADALADNKEYDKLADSYHKAAVQLLIDKQEDLYNQKLALESTLIGAELLSGMYGLTRGAAHINQYLARKAATSTGLPISRQAMLRARNAAEFANKMDKGLTIMSTVGTAADVGLLLTGDTSFVNNAEIVGGTAGIIGGTNWFRNTPFMGRYGNYVDNVLDAMGYSAAAYDVVNDGNKLINGIIDFYSGINSDSLNSTIQKINTSSTQELHTFEEGGDIEEEDPENNHWHSTRIDVKNDKLRLWMNNWLTDRQLLIGKNYAEGTPWYEHPFKDIFRKNEDIIKENSAELLLKQLNNLDNVIEYTPFHGNIANPVTEANRLDLTLKLPLTSKEALTLPLEELARKLFLTKNGYSPVTNNNIYYDTYKSIHNNNPTIHNDTVIHERTHNLANGYTPQEYYIDTQLLPTKNLIEGELFDSYLDKANEIYARLNEFRYINKLKSDQKITLLDLNKWRESGKLDYHYLERYNDNFLLHLFNDVAIDTTTNFFDRGENKYLASNGGQLKKYDTLSMRERALIIRVGVANGLRNILSIRDRYNEFVQS